MFGLFHYEDGSGYGRLQVSKITKFFRPLESFFSLEEANTFIKEGIQAYGLCPKLCGLRKVNCSDEDHLRCEGACHYTEPPKSYNSRLNDFLDKIKESQKEILVRLNGRNERELAYCVFERGMLSKFGYVSASLSDEEVLNQLSVVGQLPETYYILRQFIHKLSPEQVMILDGQKA